MIRYGIIGCGNISRFHFNALEKIGAKITYIADINEEALKPYKERFNAVCVNDYNTLIESKEVDVVCILASEAIHKDVALKAITQGKGIICEKTMANSEQDAYEIVKSAQAKGMLFFVSYMKRFFPAVQKAKELTAKLGTIFTANIRSHQPWGNFYNENHGWNLDSILKGYGGAITKCAGSHMLDMMMYLLGVPNSVYANIDFYPNTEFDRKTTAIFEYKNSLTATFEVAAHPLKKIGYEKNSWDEYIEITGTEGRLKLATVMWDNPENNAPLLTYYDNNSQTVTEYRFDITNPFDLEIEYFNKCFETGTKGTPNEVDGYNVDAVIQTMFASAKSKQSEIINRRV